MTLICFINLFYCEFFLICFRNCKLYNEVGAVEMKAWSVG